MKSFALLRPALSLRFRVVFVILLTVILLVGLFAYSMIVNFHEFLDETFEETVAGIARTGAGPVGAALAAEDGDALARWVDAVAGENHVRYAVVQRADGTVVAARGVNGFESVLEGELARAAAATEGPLVQESGTSRWLPGLQPCHDIDVTIPVFVEGRKLGWLRMGVTAEAINAATLRTLARAGIVLAAAAAVGGGVAFAVDRRFRTILRDFIAATRRMAAGNLSERVDVRTLDELQALADSFNVMAGVLAESRRRLEDLNATLEARVSERTEELQRAQTKIVHQERMAAVGLLAAGVAHEIGNPLTAISSLAQGMRRRTREEGTRVKLDEMASHIERISRVVHQMVAFARPPSFERRPAQVGEVLATTLRLLRYDPRARGVEIRFDCDPDLPILHLDADRLTQVFVNLVLNSFDAMPQGGRLSIEARREAEGVVVRFSDTGCGMNEEVRSRAFEPFFTTKPAGDGTGLGLSVSRGIVERWGGAIEIESAPGRGTVACVRLPLSPLQPGEAARGG